jgi:hypothetical protein
MIFSTLLLERSPQERARRRRAGSDAIEAALLVLRDE